MMPKTARFRTLLPGMMMAGVLAVLAVAGWLTSFAFAQSGNVPTETEVVSIFRDGDPPVLDPVEDVSLEEALGEDPLGLITYASAFRQLGRNDQVWEIWFCKASNTDSIDIDFQSVNRALSEVITPYFEWLSNGLYSPSFVEGDTVEIDSTSLLDCGPAVAEEVGEQQGLPKLIIGKGHSKTAVGLTDISWTDGGSTAGASTAYVLVDHVLPQSSDESPGTSLGDEEMFYPKLYVVAHEMGHSLGFPHSGGPINRYDNGMDLMSGGAHRFIGTIAINRYASGWIDPEDVFVYDQGSKSYMLSPLGVDGEQMLVIPHHSGERGVYYTLGPRVSQGNDVGIPKEGVEVYLIDHRESGFYRYTQPPLGSFHVLGLGDSMDLGSVRVEVTERTSDNKFTVEIEPSQQTPITVEWSDPIVVPEGPGDNLDKIEGKLFFSRSIPKDMVLAIVPRTGAQYCDRPDLPDITIWSSITDLVSDRLLNLQKGDQVATVDLRSPPGWNPDSIYEPDETFCLTITDLPAGMQWKDPTRTVLPITLLNDDPNSEAKIEVRWSDPIVVPEGDPTNEADNVDGPSGSPATARLIFDQPVDRSFDLSAWFRTGAGCAHPGLENPVWASHVDVGVEGWNQQQSSSANKVHVAKDAMEVTVPVWWTADRDYEPNETFCVIIPNLTFYSGGILHWDDSTRTVLPITLQNDDPEPPVNVSWGSSVSVAEGDPGRDADPTEWRPGSEARATLTFSPAVREDVTLEIWPQTGTDDCQHPALPNNPTWADGEDYGATQWQNNQARHIHVGKETGILLLPIWWTADRTHEPDETFCLTITDLPAGMQWKPSTPTVLPVTLQNDDPPPPTNIPTQPDNTGPTNTGGGGGGGPTNTGGGGGGGGPTNTGGGGGGGPTNTGGGGGGGPTNTGGGGGSPTGTGGESAPVDTGCMPGNFVGVFCDEDGSVHEANIEVLAGWKITLGCKQNQFCPQAQISRSQMAAFLYRAVTRHSGAPPSGTAELPDVGESVWYRPFAEWSVATGVMSMVDGEFKPRSVVTRADMAVMIAAAFPDLIPQGEVTGMFTDTAGLDDATIRAMEGMHRAGVTLGCSTAPLRYCPNQPVTRAQMASFFVRALT